MTENAPTVTSGLHVDDARDGVLDGLLAVPRLRGGSSAPLRAADAR